MIKVVTTTRIPPDGFKGACAVYRATDINGHLLYVGATRSPQNRILAHSRSSEWFEMAAKIAISWHKSRESALNAEAKIIMMCKPKFNKACSLMRVSEAFLSETRVRVWRPKNKRGFVPKNNGDALPDMTTVAANLVSEWIKKEGIKLGWVCAQIPADRATVWRWMQGKSTPHPMARNRLAEVTGIDMLRDAANWGKVE